MIIRADNFCMSVKSNSTQHGYGTAQTRHGISNHHHNHHYHHKSHHPYGHLHYNLVSPFSYKFDRKRAGSECPWDRRITIQNLLGFELPIRVILTEVEENILRANINPYRWLKIVIGYNYHHHYHHQNHDNT